MHTPFVFLLALLLSSSITFTRINPASLALGTWTRRSSLILLAWLRSRFLFGFGWQESNKFQPQTWALRFAIVVCATLPAFSQATNPSQVVRDPQAQLVTQRALNALGGTGLFSQFGGAVALVQRANVANAKPLKFEDGWNSSSHEFRRESPGGSVLVSNHGKGRLKHTNGTSDLPPHVSYGIAPYYLPGAVLYADLKDPQVGFKYVGAESVGGSNAVHVQIWNSSGVLQNRQSVQDWYFDLETGLPLKVGHRIAVMYDGAKFIPVTTEYRNFQQISGVFTATELIEEYPGQTEIVNQLASLSLVANLPASDFEVGGVQ